MILWFSWFSRISVFSSFCYVYDACPCELPERAIHLPTRFLAVWGAFYGQLKNKFKKPADAWERCNWISDNFMILSDFLIFKFSLRGVFILGSRSRYQNSTLFRHVLITLRSFIEKIKLGFIAPRFKDRSISRKKTTFLDISRLHQSMTKRAPGVNPSSPRPFLGYWDCILWPV